MCQGAQQTFPHLLGVLFQPETALRIEGSISPTPPCGDEETEDQKGIITGLRLHSEAGVAGAGLSGVSLCAFSFASCPLEAVAGGLAGGWGRKEGRKSAGEDSRVSWTAS